MINSSGFNRDSADHIIACLRATSLANIQIGYIVMCIVGEVHKGMFGFSPKPNILSPFLLDKWGV